ncbi:hypothetical protein GOP47_0004534 [Adiantum capillus-veneris]|uniref:C2 domain-containing protein n=1 Tax=Adiantum capillus-veneris TaxID=13818 RepID=A0A9D4V8V2_ADICA|nr:hypothetical protein GOP47_0004534 [Adiantum capillus-veneris]
MANYSTPWTLPPSFMYCDTSFKGTMPSDEAILMKQSLQEKQRMDDGILHVTIHQAKHIHNICIYGNQDVYAKFLLSHCQDAVYPTRPVKAGGQNPVFNQSLEIPVSSKQQQDAILKCELWMMSCARNYLEDQLLGFVLVPLKTLYGKGKQTCEYCLTSTDLFYTPAGTLQLSLSILDNNSSAAVGGEFSPLESKVLFCNSPSNFQEVMMDCGQQNVVSASMCKVEFLDLEAAAADQHLVSMYYKLANNVPFEECSESSSSSANSGNVEISSEHAGHGSLSAESHTEYATPFEVKDPLTTAPLARLHAPSVSSVDDEMVVSPREECMHMPSYLPGLVASSEMQEMANVNVGKELSHVAVEAQSPAAGGQLSAECGSKQSPDSAAKEMVQETEKTSATCQADQAMTDNATPPVNASVEPETAISQEHFVDLYLKSMQQFTDKLADMKFSFDIDSKDLAALRSVQVDRKVADGRKKEGSKLYYGSRAFY